MKDSQFVVVALQSAGASRKETFLGRSFRVIPAVLVRSQVLSNNLGRCYLPPADITDAWAQLWNGIPVLVGPHPTQRGVPCSGRESQLWNERLAGWIFQARAEQESADVRHLRGEVWLDESRVDSVEGLQAVLEKVDAGEPVELSTGFLADQVQQVGMFQGSEYQIVLHPQNADHLVISTEMTGACSVRDGCGLGVNKYEGTPPMESSALQSANIPSAIKWLKKAIARHKRHMDGTESTSESSQQEMMREMEKALAALDGATTSATMRGEHPVEQAKGTGLRAALTRALDLFSREKPEPVSWEDNIARNAAREMEIRNSLPSSDQERANKIRVALQDKIGSRGECIVVDVYSETSAVVFWLMTPLGSEPPGPEYFRATFTEADGVFTFGEPDRVVRKTVYEPVGNEGAPSGATHAANCQSCTTQEKPTMAETKDGKAAENGTPSALESMVSTLASAVQTLSDKVDGLVKSAEADPNPAIAGLKKSIAGLSQKLEGMEGVTRTAVEERNRERQSLVESLAGNFRVPFTQEDLEGKPLEELRKIAQMAGVEDYSGKGGPRSAVGNSGSEGQRFVEPVPYFDKSKGGK